MKSYGSEIPNLVTCCLHCRTSCSDFCKFWSHCCLAFPQTANPDFNLYVIFWEAESSACRFLIWWLASFNERWSSWLSCWPCSSMLRRCMTYFSRSASYLKKTLFQKVLVLQFLIEFQTCLQLQHVLKSILGERRKWCASCCCFLRTVPRTIRCSFFIAFAFPQQWCNRVWY